MSLLVRNVAYAGLLLVSVLRAENLTIQFASPVASQSYQMKRSAFVFRTPGCAPDARAEVSATAEGKVDGQRRSIPLKVVPAASPNVFGIFREWPNQGIWVVSIKAHCAAKTAGALVATDSNGLVRESSINLDHAATQAEIEAALNAGRNGRGASTNPQKE